MFSRPPKKSHMAAIPPIAALRGGLEGLAAQGATERPRRRTERSSLEGSEEATQQMRLFQQTVNLFLSNA